MAWLTAAGVTGTTPLGSVSNFTPSCHASTTSPEDVYVFRLMQNLSTLTFSTVGSAGDTVLSVRLGDCGSPSAEIACNHIANTVEEVIISNPALGFYYVFVDGDYVSGINYVLNVSGTIGAGIRAARAPSSTRAASRPNPVASVM